MCRFGAYSGAYAGYESAHAPGYAPGYAGGAEGTGRPGRTGRTGRAGRCGHNLCTTVTQVLYNFCTVLAYLWLELFYQLHISKDTMADLPTDPPDVPDLPAPDRTSDPAISQQGIRCCIEVVAPLTGRIYLVYEFLEYQNWFRWRDRWFSYYVRPRAWQILEALTERTNVEPPQYWNLHTVVSGRRYGWDEGVHDDKVHAYVETEPYLDSEPDFAYEDFDFAYPDFAMSETEEED